MRNSHFLTLAIVAAISVETASAQIMASGPDPDWISQAKIIAEMEGISVGEAVSRTILQNKIVEETGRLAAQPGFAGVWIDRSRGPLKARIATKRGNAPPVISDREVAANATTVQVDRSMADLERDRKNIVAELAKAKIAGAIQTRVQSNDMVLITPDAEALKQRIASGTFTLPDYVVIQEGLVRFGQQATVTGAGAMANNTKNTMCTGGFTVTYNSNRGISTAGHCITRFFGMETHRGLPAGTGYPYWDSPGYDVAMYRSSTHTYINRVTLGDGAYYTITSVAPTVPVNASVCVVKRSGVQQCGFVAESAMQGTDQDGNSVGPWVRVDRYPTQDGDSGGPWLYGGKAYGSHQGYVCTGTAANCFSTFMGAPAIAALGVTINTN